MTTADSVADKVTDDVTMHASASRVLVRFFLLVSLLAALVWIGKSLLVAGVDGAAQQRAYFGAHAPPFGLVLSEAARLPGGDLLVRFQQAEGHDTRPSEPTEITLIEYQSRAAVDPLFHATEDMGSMGGGESGMGADGGVGQQLERWKREPSFAWHTTMKRAQIAFGAWSARMRIERSFLEGGGFEEEARVDLSSPERALVLFAHWGRDASVDEKALSNLLQAFVLANPAE